MRFFLILLLGFSLHARALAPQPQDLEKAIRFPVDKYVLKNGLTVLLHADSSTPQVSVQTWYRVGSKDEVPGRTGLAHFFEHMMFKGTKKFGKDTWGKTLNGKGAESNAFTTDDYTGYYIDAPSEHLPLLLEIESDRMRNLSLDSKDVNSEREVVKEERRMRYDDSIEGGIQEKMNEIMFSKLPYHWLPIGSMVDLNAASMDDLHKFYKTFYSPNNAVLVVAGDFNIDPVKKMIEKDYASLPKETIVRPTITPESPQTKERRAVIEREAQSPTVAIGYHTPNLKSDDNYALDLLAIVLGQGQSSRLYRSLVYKAELALNVYAASWSQTLASQFMIQATLRPGADPEKALKLIDAQVRNLRDAPIGVKELEKARNMLMKEYVDPLKRVAGRAHALVDNEILYGDYTRIFSDLKKYQEITPADLQRVAKAYLQTAQRNIVVVHPSQGK